MPYGRQTTRRTGTQRGRTRTATARGRIGAQMRQFQSTRPASRRRTASRQAQRSRTAGGARPNFIPAGFTNKLTKRLPSGKVEHYYCSGHTITQQGCMKVQNTTNQNRGYIAQPAGTGRKLGSGGASRTVRR